MHLNVQQHTAQHRAKCACPVVWRKNLTIVKQTPHTINMFDKHRDPIKFENTHLSTFYLSIAIAQLWTDYKITDVCLSVCVSVIAPAVAILNRIWWNFAFGAGKQRSTSFSSLGGQNPIMYSPILSQFSPIFTTATIFAIRRSKHCGIEAR